MKKLEWHTEKRIIEDLLPYDKNPRKLSIEKLDLLKKSIEKYGFVEIPVIDIDNVILAGHQRLKAMQILGRGKEETDVRVPNRKLTESEFKEYNIQSNVAIGEWDIDTLLEDFNDIDLPDLGVEIDDLEFQLSDEFEVSKERFIEMKNIKAEDEAEDPDLAVPEVAKSVKGDIYELISEDKNLTHRVMCGDSTIEEDVEKLMDGQKAGMVFTDPPYGIDYSGGRTQTIKKVE
ncbi:MAG: ParB N-terminal domain-containing protein, partial [Nanoarchaeota archaeon]|nr:ParB N-terminal domain-containing protein [Nanoarchaeota archaeon]